MRTTMGAERFSGLALLSVHRNVPVDIKALVKDYLAAGPRRPAPFANVKELFDTDNDSSSSSSQD